MSPIDHIRRYHDELDAIRQDFHAHPELGLEEHRTAEIVAKKLEEWGIEVHRGIGGTGVVGVLRSGNGPQSIGLRMDMDALPIVEANDVPYKSRTPGVMPTGRILLDGKLISSAGADRGMVFQSYTLFPWLTVAQNVGFGLRERGVPLRERTKIVGEWLEKVGLTSFANHFPKQLSGGMQQRTAIARALANDPKILLLDEPFGALDNQTRALMQELLLGIWERERKTVIFVTHDIEEAIFLASRVVVMSARPGRIKADVAVSLSHPRRYTIKTSPEFSALKAQLTEEIRVEAVLAAEVH